MAPFSLRDPPDRIKPRPCPRPSNSSLNRKSTIVRLKIRSRSVEPLFNQMQVQQAIEFDFAAGMRTLLRQDPDVIMIGEIRDRETADIAAQAALTGHLVLSTLHTNHAPSVITRLMDIGEPSYLIGATLLGVVAQRLVRTLCDNCKTPVKLPPST